MNGAALLITVDEAFKETRLEAVLIGNAAAALHGAPVTTLDLDFMFRKTTRHLAKLKEIAKTLEAQILRPYYPASDLFRVINEDRGLQVDFMAAIHGVRSFAGLRARAQSVKLGGSDLLVADLRDIIASKRAAGRARDLAVLEVLETTLREKEKLKDGKT